MQIDELLPLGALAAKLGRRRGGKRTHSSTLARWARKGLRGVRLEVVRVGGVLCSSEAALMRFFAELGAARPQTPPETADRGAMAKTDDLLVDAALKSKGLLDPNAKTPGDGTLSPKRRNH